MNTDYTHQYLALIEEVAEDGELTHKEIYLLAKWLNENKDGRKAWPANQFLPLLKEVFADGTIAKSEARQVAALIQRVRREWAREHARSADSVSATAVNDPIVNFDDGQPRLPLIAAKTMVGSFSEPDVDYAIDFSGPSCSCPDFSTYRKHLPIGHISRCCKHIMQGYSEIRPSNGWPSWLEPFLEAGFRPYPEQNWMICKSGSCNFLVSSANPEWGNVYGRIGDECVKYGYNIHEERWSYGKEPDEARMFSIAIHKLSK